MLCELSGSEKTQTPIRQFKKDQTQRIKAFALYGNPRHLGRGMNTKKSGASRIFFAFSKYAYAKTVASVHILHVV